LTDDITRSIYSTDASAYCEKPLAVAYPADSEDIKKILDFCSQNRIGLTMRGAGTSLAGQVVGGGIIVDISKNMTDILEINIAEKWVRVQPGVILDELNMHIKPHGLFFGPETSTSNRCNIGGMVGNNACGSHSLVYGSTREHLLELKCILSDGSEAIFKTLTEEEFNKLANKTNLEGALYRNIRDILTDDSNLLSIREGFPDPAITRRNTGYCLDILADTELFDKSSSKKFNFAKSLVDLPLPHKALVCAHLGERNDAFHANLVALRHGPVAIEMMDSKLLKLAETNLSQRNNKFFISGEPGAILMIEITGESSDIVMEKCTKLINDLKTSKYGYAYPIIMGGDIQKVWEFRKAGLGTLSNLRGDANPVSLIEDTAVRPQDLPVYMEELTAMLTRYGKEVVLHAHIGTGELHVRPIINLKDESDVALFREIGKETALLVKRFRGSLSGEHGDGRLRGEFIPIVLGRRNFTLIEKVKKAWDPENILNPGVIVNTLPMNTFLRYDPGTPVKEPDTIFDFSSTGGIIRGAENCNGSAENQ